MNDTPQSRYVKSGDAHIAYQVVGDGPRDLLVLSGGFGNIEGSWQHPLTNVFFRRLASFARVIFMDMRGTGLSDRADHLPTFEQQMDDVHAVLDAAGASSTAVLTLSQGGPLGILFAATYPERVSALVLYAAYARFERTDDYPWGRPPGWLDEVGGALIAAWGTGVSVALMAPSMADDEEFVRWWGERERATFSPGGFVTFVELQVETDVRALLPTLQVPTLVVQRADDTFRDPGHAHYIAEQIPGAELVMVPGRDHAAFVGDVGSILDPIEEFLTGARHAVEVDRVLATVLFTDIVDSTQRASELGDKRWRELLTQHDTRATREIDHFRGRTVKTTGDGVLATFDGPARAIRCAQAIAKAVGGLGLTIRAGLHTGEIELAGDDVRGIAVHIGARVAALASEGEVLVSSMVKDLVIGSGIEFDERGTHDLKGVPGTWALYAVTSA